MAETQPNSSASTPKDLLSGLFGPKFLDDPTAISGIASTLGIGGDSGAAQGGSPQIPGPVSPVVPRSFQEWASDPVNTAKIVPQTNNAPMPGLNPPNQSVPPLIARPPEDLGISQPQSAPAAASAVNSAPLQANSGQGMPLAPANAQPGQPQPSDLFPNKADWLKANPNAAAIPLPPHQYGTRGSIAMALATLGDNMGSVLSGIAPSVGQNWLKQVAAGQEYQRQLPVVTQKAQNEAYDQAQAQAGKTAGIRGTQAQTSHVEAETAALLGGGPFYEQAGKIRQEIQQLWQSGSLAPADFDKAVSLKMQGLAPNVARLIPADFGQQVKGLPQTPPKFTAGGNGIEPITYRGQNFGVVPTPGEPAEITKARQAALDSQTQNETSKQSLKAGEFPPVVVARLGKPPIGDPVAMADYGKKAQDIMAAISSAPRIAMTMSRPTQIAEVDAQGNPTGRILYETAGEAMSSGAMAPGSVPFQADKKVTISATSGPIADKITAFNTAIAHAALLKKAAEALNNGDSRTLAGLSNRLKTEFGDPDITNFDAIANAYNHEVTSVISKGHITDKEVEKGGGTMPSNANLATTNKVLDSYTSLMSSKMQQLQQQVEKGQKGQINFPDTASQGGSGAAPEGTIINVNGQKQVKRGGKWVPM